MSDKFALLKSYSLANQRDSWVAMGQSTMSNSTRIFTTDSLFKVTQSSVPLFGGLIFCTEGYTSASTFTWANIRENVAGASSGELIDNITNIILPNLRLVMTKATLDAIVPAYDPAFLPFQEVGAGSLLNISDDELNMILIEAGVPFISLEELEYSRDNIINYMIWPAVMEYYKYFPITSIGSYPLADSNFNIPIPAEPIFTVVHAQVVPGYPISTATGNPILRYFDESLMAISPRGAFSTPNLNSSRRQGFVDTQSYSTFVLEKAARQGIINYGTRRRVAVRIQAGFVKGYTTQRGVLELTWGAYSHDWTDTLLTRRVEIRDLAKANVLRNFAMLRMQAKSDLPGVIDYTGFLSRADVLETRVKEIWSNTTMAPLIRS